MENESMHVWHGGTVCHKCGLHRKFLYNGFVLYRVDRRWSTKRPDCRVIGSGDTDQ